MGSQRNIGRAPPDGWDALLQGNLKSLLGKKWEQYTEVSATLAQNDSEQIIVYWILKTDMNGRMQRMFFLFILKAELETIISKYYYLLFSWEVEQWGKKSLLTALYT